MIRAVTVAGAAAWLLHGSTAADARATGPTEVRVGVAPLVPTHATPLAGSHRRLGPPPRHRRTQAAEPERFARLRRFGVDAGLFGLPPIPRPGSVCPAVRADAGAVGIDPLIAARARPANGGAQRAASRCR